MVGVGLAVVVLLFGNNIYQQATGKAFFSPTNLIYIVIAMAVIGLGFVYYQRSNAFILDNSKSFIGGSLARDGTWVHISGFIFYAVNKSRRPITHVDGFLRSNITNQTFPVYLVDSYGNNIHPSESNGIPPRSKDIPIFVAFVLDENGEPDKKRGIDLNTLLSTLRDSTLVLSLDGKSFQHHISERKVRAELEARQKQQLPTVAPSVTRKSNPPK